MAKSKIWSESSDLARIPRPISGLDLGLTTAGSLKFGIEVLSEIRVGHGIRFRLVGEEGWDQWTGVSGGVDRFLQTVAIGPWERWPGCGRKSGFVERDWVKRKHSEGVAGLMVISRTCVGGVTSRNGKNNGAPGARAAGSAL